MRFLNFSILIVLCYSPSIQATGASCWKFPRPLSYNETKIYLLTNSMIIGTTFNNLFPDSSEKYEVDINLYYSLQTPLASNSTSITLKDLDTTKSILLTIDEDAIQKLVGGGAGKEVPITDIEKLDEDVKLDSIKESLNKLFVDLTISSSGIISKVGENNFTGIAWSCEESQAYVKEASTPLNADTCYKFTNVGGKYGDYYAFIPTKRVYGGLTVEKALSDTIDKLLDSAIEDPLMRMMAKAMIQGILPGIHVIASVDVDFIQATDITKINLTNIREDTGLLFTENTQLVTGVLDECLEEGIKINEVTTVEQIIRVANCFIKQNTTNVKAIMALVGGMVQIPTNITVDMSMITPFLPMVAEYFNGLYLNKQNNPTLMVDVGDDVTVKAIGETFDCKLEVDLRTLGHKEYIAMPKVNVILPKELFSVNGNFTFYTDSSTYYLGMILNSADVKDKLPSPLNTDDFKLVIDYQIKLETNEDGESKITLNFLSSARSTVYALTDEAASNLATRVGKESSTFKWNNLDSINMTDFNTFITAELSKIKTMSAKTVDVTRGENKRGKGTFKINGNVYQDLGVYFEYPAEEFEVEEIEFKKVPPTDARPLPRDDCYKFKAEGGEFGTYYVNIKERTVKGGIVVANALKNIGDLIPPMVAQMMSFDNIYAWAEVKLDYIDHVNVTKINVTEILETTFIQFTGLEDKALVSMLGGMVPELAILNKPIYLSDLLKNVGNLLAAIKGIMPDLEIPDGPLGLDNITQFLPLAYEYFDGMYWSDIRNKAEFSLSVPPSTVVNALGEKMDCSIPPSSGLPETIPVYNYIFSFRNNVPGIKGIFVINGLSSIINAKLNCSDYKHLLPESMQDLNCYISIKYNPFAMSDAQNGFTRFSVNKFSLVTASEKNRVITIEPRDENAFKQVVTIMEKTNPDDSIQNVCDSVEYRSLIDLSQVAESDKDTEAYKILGNLYDSVGSNITSIFNVIYLKYANVSTNGVGRVDLSTPGIYDVKVWTTSASAPELDCAYEIPPYDDSDDIDKPTTPSNDMSSSVSLSYLIGLIMILLGIILM